MPGFKSKPKPCHTTKETTALRKDTPRTERWILRPVGPLDLSSFKSRTNHVHANTRTPRLIQTHYRLADSLWFDVYQLIVRMHEDSHLSVWCSKPKNRYKRQWKQACVTLIELADAYKSYNSTKQRVYTRFSCKGPSLVHQWLRIWSFRLTAERARRLDVSPNRGTFTCLMIWFISGIE